MDPQQEISNETLETILVSSTKGSYNNNNNNNNKRMEEEMKKKHGGGGEAQKCPRCESPNTKFCYYNNYSLSQPRYFCKSCRRYWTKGGTLRNVPVGGGCRRNKRSSSSSSSSFLKNNNSNPISFHNDQLHNPLITGMPSSFGYDSIDLNVAFATLHKHSSSHQATTSFGFGDNLSVYGNSTNTNSNVFGGIFGGQNGTFSNGSLCYGFMSEHENESKRASSSLGFSLEGNERKQENLNNNNNISENQSKLLWGFPWQMAGDSAGAAPEVDQARESWSVLASSWHNGLLNTPLV